MPIPEPTWRCPTRKAIDSLAEKFNLPNTPDMQDWEWEVADPSRIEEFLVAYESGELSDDERFTLVETIFQSFEELPDSIDTDPRWAQVLDILVSHFELHAYSVWYWSDLKNETKAEDSWRVTPFLRQVLAKHQRILELP